MDGNGLDDYIIVEPKTGAISVYLNLGKADTSVIGDGIRFAVSFLIPLTTSFITHINRPLEKPILNASELGS
jgi:hypothetical protein